ncbi:MAG TPA: hypothetical protein VM510_08945, partial [Caulifigura sp.]|nr:hypothetical protein [Caulifigura sp.]
IVRPIRTARRITIRAAPRRRPQLEIGLNRDEAMSGSVASPKIFNVAGGALSIADVDLVLNLPAGSSGRWSIFALTQGGRVSLRGASITVQNRDRLPVAVIDAASGGARAIARAVTEAMAERPLEVSLESCLVRGGADLVWQDGADVVDIRVAQSALALNGALFRQTAGPPTDAMTTGRGPNELLLEHVTAVLERPLVSIELGDRESTRPLQFDCRNSVIKVTDAIQPLISVIGQGDVNDYLDALTWNGRHNWFDLAGPAVEISTPGVAGPLLTTLRIDEWLSRWSARGASEAEQRASGELFANGEAWRQGDFTRIDPDDFTLNGSSSNPVLRGADDGGAAGVDLEQRTFPKAMPALPAPRSAERSSRRRYAEDPGLERIETPETRR